MLIEHKLVRQMRRINSLRMAVVLIATFVFCTETVAQSSGATAKPPLGALDPVNLAKKRLKPPFDITGTWMMQSSKGQRGFGPPYPKFAPRVEELRRQATEAAAAHKPFHDDTSYCYPPGMPKLMDRVWPIAMIQLPTAVYMVSNYENEFRTVFMDGRPHTDPDLLINSYNGESIGRWEGKSLIIDTVGFVEEHHWLADGDGVPVSQKAHLIETYTMNPDKKTFNAKFTLIDPDVFEGEWTINRDFQRILGHDVSEYACTQDLIEKLPGYGK